MDLGERKISTQQVCDGRVIEPMAMESPFCTGIDQTIKSQCQQHLIPVGALTARGQTFAPENIQIQLLP